MRMIADIMGFLTFLTVMNLTFLDVMVRVSKKISLTIGWVLTL
jgi:hypothetical protein